jgi:integrase
LPPLIVGSARDSDSARITRCRGAGASTVSRLSDGSERNLIHYDVSSIDAYALRHAFAQRYADAVDAEGRSTTPPDVLQDLMDHQDFKTTMTYYNPRELPQTGVFPQVA